MSVVIGMEMDMAIAGVGAGKIVELG